MRESGVIQPTKNGGIGDFVSVQMQNRQHRSISRGIQEFVGMPTGRERPRFRFTVADDAGYDQTGIVERGSIRVSERITEFSTFVD